MPACLVCKTPIAPFLDLGLMPIANGFLSAEEFGSERFFPLRVGVCPECRMAQLTHPVEPHLMFHDRYAFFSSTSRGMAEHFERLASHLISEHLPPGDPFVVEIGSNDGITLRHFARSGIRHLGIEPSSNVADAARAQGVRTDTRFFDSQAARDILTRDGPADLLLGTNVMCHIAEIHGVLEGSAILLAPRGILVFEDPYLGDILEKTSYDQIYDEHVFYFSVTSVDALVAKHGLELFDVRPQPVHGGSMRYYVSRPGAHPVTDRVRAQRRMEDAMGLGDPRTYERFGSAVQESRRALLGALRRLKAEGKRVVAYGATSKSTTVTNFCGITPDLVEFVTDTTPAKQGKYTPGVHLPVRPPEEFHRNPPDVALLFAWNHQREIVEKERAWLDRGGQFLTYVPRVAMIGSAPLRRETTSGEIP